MMLKLRMELTRDKLGRDVVVIDDTDAHFLKDAASQGWREWSGVGAGRSATFPHGCKVAEMLDAILWAVDPNGTTSTFYGAVIGESGWDPTESWWRGDTDDWYPHLVGPSFSRSYDGSGDFTFYG